MNGKILSLLCALIIGLACLAPAGQAADEVKITPVQVTDRIYVLFGQGGNIGVFIGEDGTFMIDDQFAPLTGKILEAVKSVGGEHPKFLINTHYHGDHTGGNENLGQGGTLIISHDNVRERLSTGSFLKPFNMKGAPLSPKGLPVVTFSEDVSFHLNGDSLHAVHVPHAHTDGDSFIHFKAANVIHAGDIFFNGFYPFIDVDHGGALKGMIMAVDKILSMADDGTKIIPGHGPMANKEQLTEYRQMLGIAYERLRKLKAEGKSAKEAAATKPLGDLEAVWGDGLFKGERWIEIIYPGV
ncbi:MAG: MBL fold metallo-hydrolase [Desulfobacterales bacterium]|nr:MBL fold metallo-hydrolase [Desulfobacterales bacterium]